MQNPTTTTQSTTPTTSTTPDPFDFDEQGEECPGCGCEPGEDLTPGCDHPLGCGFWRDLAAEHYGDDRNAEM